MTVIQLNLENARAYADKVPKHHRVDLEERIAAASREDLEQYVRDAALMLDCHRQNIEKLAHLTKATSQAGHACDLKSKAMHELFRSLNRAMQMKAHGAVRTALQQQSSIPFTPGEWPHMNAEWLLSLETVLDEHG